MLTVTQTSYSCHEVLEKKSTDSSPSHSQVSRNSSRKSNNSLLVTNGKIEGKWMVQHYHYSALLISSITQHISKVEI
jgi:hypothetical protein